MDQRINTNCTFHSIELTLIIVNFGCIRLLKLTVISVLLQNVTVFRCYNIISNLIIE